MSDKQSHGNGVTVRIQQTQSYIVAVCEWRTKIFAALIKEDLELAKELIFDGELSELFAAAFYELEQSGLQRRLDELEESVRRFQNCVSSNQTAENAYWDCINEDEQLQCRLSCIVRRFPSIQKTTLLKPCQLKAFRQYNSATQQNPELGQDREVYDWLCDHSDSLDEMPQKFSTWQKHLSVARTYYDENKHNSRFGRGHGKSIVRSKQI